MNEAKITTRIAGVDVSKPRLDVAVHGSQAAIQVANTPAGHAELAAWLARHDVARVGLEATGGYERACASALRAAGLEVVLHQPLEVRLFARIKRLKAKNDRIDARLIALATAQVDTLKAATDPRMGELAERLTAYDQASDLLAQMRTTMEHLTLPDLIGAVRSQIDALTRHKARLATDLQRRIRAQPDLARRFDLLRSLPGVGPVVAAALVVRMPELGAMKRGQAAALIGVAPFDRDSGSHKGQRFISGGRARPRRLLYLAALAAKRSSPAHRVFAQRLLDIGKPPKVAIVAVMRKLIEAANLVLARNTPWQPQSN